MLIKSGLSSDDLSASNPLDVEGARQLQRRSADYQANSRSNRNSSMSTVERVGFAARSKSAGARVDEDSPPISEIVTSSETAVSANTHTPASTRVQSRQQTTMTSRTERG